MVRACGAWVTIAALVVLLAAPGTLAQATRQKEALATHEDPRLRARSVAEPVRAPLAGPEVGARKRAPTLVEREVDGRVRRLDIAPEERAIELMSVEGAPGTNLEELFRRRARVMDRFVAENIDLLNRANTETREGFKGALILEALGKLDALWKDGTLEEQVRALLPKARHATFDALVGEYWDAIVAERREREPAAKRFQIMLSEKGDGLGREIKSAFERTQRSGEFIYGYATRGLTGELALSREQEKRVRGACARFADAAKGGEGTKAEQAVLFIDVASVLGERQLEVVIATLQGRKVEPRPAGGAK